MDPNVGAHDGERGYFSVIRSGGPGRAVVLAATSDVPVAAWRSPDFDGTHVCDVDPLAVDATHAAFGIRAYAAGEPRGDRIYFGALEDIGDLTEPVAVLDSSWLPGANAIQHLVVSATTVAAEVQLAGYIAVFQDGVLGRLVDTDSAVRGSPQNLQVVGSTVYWNDFADRVRIARGSLSEPESFYVDIAGADVRGPQVDGEWVAWQQAAPVGGPYDTVELWASPFAADPAELEPVRKRVLGNFVEYRMGDGIYAVVRGPSATEPRDHIELYDLADGRRRVFRPPADHRIRAAPLYVTRDEMLISMRIDGSPSVVRVQLADLPYEE